MRQIDMLYSIFSHAIIFLPIQIGQGSGGGLGGGCLKMTLHMKKEFLLISTGALYERGPGARGEHSRGLEHEHSL